MIPPATRNPTTITNPVLSYCSKQDRSEPLLVLFIIERGIRGMEGYARIETLVNTIYTSQYQSSPAVMEFVIV